MGYSASTSGTLVQYDVEATTSAGAKYTLAAALKDLGEVQWLTAEIRRLLGL